MNDRHIAQEAARSTNHSACVCEVWSGASENFLLEPVWEQHFSLDSDAA